MKDISLSQLKIPEKMTSLLIKEIELLKIFIKYYTVTDEEETIDERKSGFGSTDGN